MRPLALLSLLAVAMAGCSTESTWPDRDLEGGDPEWRDTDLPPGYALEMDFPLRKDAELPYDWFVMDRTEIPFEVHYHRSDGSDVKAFQGTFFEHTGPFVAEESAMYSLLWKNFSDHPIELWVQVEGEQCYPQPGGGTRCGTLVEI